MNNKNLPSLKAAYYFWVGLLVITTAYSMIIGDYQNDMSVAIDAISPLPDDGLTREQMLIAFIVISLGYAFLLVVIAGFLIYKVEKGKKWALWVLSIFSVWQAIDSIYGLIAIRNAYPEIVDLGDWVVAIVISITWVYILIIPHLNKPNGELGEGAL